MNSCHGAGAIFASFRPLLLRFGRLIRMYLVFSLTIFARRPAHLARDFLAIKSIGKQMSDRNYSSKHYRNVQA